MERMLGALSGQQLKPELWTQTPHTCGIPLATRVEFRRSGARCSAALR